MQILIFQINFHCLWHDYVNSLWWCFFVSSHKIVVRTFCMCFSLIGDSCVKCHINDGVAVVKFDTPDSKVGLICYIIYTG